MGDFERIQELLLESVSEEINEIKKDETRRMFIRTILGEYKNELKVNYEIFKRINDKEQSIATAKFNQSHNKGDENSYSKINKFYNVEDINIKKRTIYNYYRKLITDYNGELIEPKNPGYVYTNKEELEILRIKAKYIAKFFASIEMFCINLVSYLTESQEVEQVFFGNIVYTSQIFIRNHEIQINQIRKYFELLINKKYRNLNDKEVKNFFAKTLSYILKPGVIEEEGLNLDPKVRDYILR